MTTANMPNPSHIIHCITTPGNVIVVVEENRHMYFMKYTPIDKSSTAESNKQIILSYSSLHAPFHSWWSPHGFRMRTTGMLPDTVGVSTSTYRQQNGGSVAADVDNYTQFSQHMIHVGQKVSSQAPACRTRSDERSHCYAELTVFFIHYSLHIMCMHSSE